jgi:hypothetical protein
MGTPRRVHTYPFFRVDGGKRDEAKRGEMARKARTKPISLSPELAQYVEQQARERFGGVTSRYIQDLVLNDKKNREFAARVQAEAIRLYIKKLTNKRRPPQR